MGEEADTLKDLLDAAKNFQSLQNPWELVSVQLFTDGSGAVLLSGDPIYPFHEPQEAIEFLYSPMPAEG